MARRRGGLTALALGAALATAGPAAADTVDFQLFAHRDKACAYLATAKAEDVARVEIWLTILQRDASSENRMAVARGDLQRLQGERRVVEAAIAAMNTQIVEGHASLDALRSRLRTMDALPASEAAVRGAERNLLEIDIRAISEELIETSFHLRDAKARHAAMQAAIAGRRDDAAMIDDVEATVRQFGGAIRECARLRRDHLATLSPDVVRRR